MDEQAELMKRHFQNPYASYAMVRGQRLFKDARGMWYVGQYEDVKEGLEALFPLPRVGRRPQHRRQRGDDPGRSAGGLGGDVENVTSQGPPALAGVEKPQRDRPLDERRPHGPLGARIAHIPSIDGHPGRRVVGGPAPGKRVAPHREVRARR